MVQSLINPDVCYPEVDTIDPEDVGYAAQVCEMARSSPQEDKFMLIAIGKVKYTFHDRGILYYPIYLLTMDDKKQLVAKSKIGLVEVPVKHALIILDENKEIRLDLLEDPLLFAFANEDYLDRFSTDEVPVHSKKTPVPTTEEQKEEPEEEEDDDASESVQKARHLIAHGIFKQNERIVLPPPVPEETETESKTLTEAFESSSMKDAKFWVQRFLKNDRFGFHTVHGSDSESLFACICDAFQQIGKDTTVAKLKAVVALEATASVFKSRREAYEHLVHKVRDKKLRLDKMKESSHKDKDDAAMTALTHDIVYDERLVKELVGEEFREITTLQHFREFIMTHRFVPDDWAIGVLEQKLHVKLIVLSESEFEDGDVHHVVHCFRSSNTKPQYYIVVSKNKRGSYVVVTYKNQADHDVGKRIFSFSELPFGLRHHIGRRCSERSGHGFQHIQEFDDLASKHGHDDHRRSNSGGDPDDEMRLQFYRFASNQAIPGKGPNEHVPVDQLYAFQPLRKIHGWRRKLDDTWAQSKFQLDGKTWASVVHYTQSVQFKKHHKEYADTFSLDSRTALSKNVDLALAATQENKKTMKTKPSQIEVDKEMTAEEALKHRVAALHAKFLQNADLQQLLKATLTATLMHYVPKRGAQPDDALMALRDTIH